MFRCIVLFMVLIVPAFSRYSAANCRETCIALSECQSLLNEIKAAGSPMPMYMSQKLQKITCGFNFEEPLVCCSSSNPSSGTENPFTSKPTDIDVFSVWSNGGGDKTGSQTNPNMINGVDKRGNNDGPEDVQNHPNLRLLPTNCGNIDSNRILGGNRTQLYEMPWMVILSYDSEGENKLSCGGTLINEWYVLTAAHCVTLLGDRMTLNGAILGEYDVRSDPDCEVMAGKTICAPSVMNVTIDEIIAHPGYRRQTLFDDIALLRLSQPANFDLDTMGPICLPITPSLQRESLEGLSVVVAGWGLTEEKIQSPVLMSVPLPVISNEECQAAYKGTPRLYNKQVCAGGVRDKDSCGGDSGGPLMYPGRLGTGGVRYVQRGVVSFGPRRCGIGGLPGVYTRVAYYMKWILDNMHI